MIFELAGTTDAVLDMTNQPSKCPNLRVVNPALRPSCSTCSLATICLPLGLPEYDINKLDELIRQHITLQPGEHLFRDGDAFSAIYAVRQGSFKTFVLSEDGREQVTGFRMTGDILGVDAISAESHDSHAVALENSEVCVIPFKQLEQLLGEIPLLQRNFHRLMSREIVRDQSVMMTLGNMRAEERLAKFLVNLSRRHAVRGHSPTHFRLPMSREEIGSYTGMRLETVSRTLKRLQNEDLIAIANRHVTIKDMTQLEALAGQPDERTII